MKTTFFTLLLCACFGPAILAAGQSRQPTKPPVDAGYTLINREHVAWPSPESLLTDLRSSDPAVRLKPLVLAGLDDQQAHETVWSSGNDSPAKVVDRAVITPGRIQLTYAPLGSDTSKQAILAFEDRSLGSTYAAVAVLTKHGWERVAAMNCWCKYDMKLGQDMLAEFISLRPAPENPAAFQPLELVVHSSGGGTGIYTQYEAHFRIFRGELHQTLQFVSRFRSNDPTGPSPSLVKLERRWFVPTPIGPTKWGGILVEATGTFDADKAPQVEWDVRGLQETHLHNIKCRAYRWNEKNFVYEPSHDLVPACEVPTK
jgi:hypothetical protein